MKSFKLFLVLALLIGASLAIVTPAFALDCKNGNYGSDECWTGVQVSSSETTPVRTGSVLVYDFQSSATAGDAAYQVRVADASADAWFVAGVAQKTIATGDQGIVLVRGQGKICLKSSETVTSGDALFVGASADATKVQVTGTRQLAFALETTASATGATTRVTKDAYIVIG